MAHDLGPTLKLAGPVVLAELGWVAMGVVDTLILGRLGAEAIGAASVGSTLFFTVAVFGMGMLLGLDTLVSQAFGAGRLDDCRRSLVQGLYLGLVLTPVLTALVLAAGPWLELMGVQPSVARLAVPYIRATAWSVAPLLVYAACRRYLQSTGRVGAVVFALVSANVINALANWVLVFGHLGFGAWGVAGSGWATTLSRVYMALVVAVAAARPDRGRTAPPGTWRLAAQLDPARIRRLLRLGFPAALHTTLEVGVFAMATTLAGRLDPSALAAHQIVLSVASVTFMIPLGLSSAAAVRVGQALGRADARGAAHAGWTAIALGAGFMCGSGLTFLAVPTAIISGFTADPAVMAVGLGLLQVAAAFQLFDGLQGVTTGALRGAGDTHTPMVVNLFAHWALGLPCGYLLAFPGGLGALGLWMGLSLGLIVAGIVLVRTWSVKVHRLEQAVPLHARFQPKEPGAHVAAKERGDRPFERGA